MERADFEKWKPKEVARLLALVETERRYYQEIVASLPVSLVIVGPQLNTVSSNRQFRFRVGKKNEEILGKPIGELLPIEGIREIASQVIASGASVPAQELIWDGNRVLVSSLPLRHWDEDSEAEALLVLEERVAQNPALSSEQIRLIDAASQIDGMLWQFDYASASTTYVSEGAEALFGYPVKHWMNGTNAWDQRVHEQDRERVQAFYSQLDQDKGTVYSVEYRANHPSKEFVFMRESIRVTRNEQGRPIQICGLITNITDRRELEQQHALSAKAEGLQRLSAKLAHDLNNLLMIVAGYGEELKNALPAQHPLHQDMQQILGATERLYSMTTQFQTYTRRPTINAKDADVASLLGQARTRIEQTAGSGFLVDLKIAQDVGKVCADPVQLEEALVLLARYAASIGRPEGRLVLGAENVTRTESVGLAGAMRSGAYVRISIEQANPPGSRELLEPWMESSEAAREAELGFATAYQILRQTQGDLSVEGRFIHVYVPMPRQADQRLAKAHAAGSVVEIPQEAESTLETILVVEDEGGIRALVRKILRRQGYHVLEASSGEEALAALAGAGGKVDLLLTDVMMPGMNGVELSQRALSSQSSLKVLFVSGYTDESVLEAGKFPAGTAFLQKPFTLGSLLGKVREVLDGGAVRQAAS